MLMVCCEDPGGIVGGGNGLAYRHGISPGEAESPELMIWSWLSSAYNLQARMSCFWLLRHLAAIPRSFALANTGSSKLARIAIIAITTSNSISVKPLWPLVAETDASLFIASLKPRFPAKIRADRGVLNYRSEKRAPIGQRKLKNRRFASNAVVTGNNCDLWRPDSELSLMGVTLYPPIGGGGFGH